MTNTNKRFIFIALSIAVVLLILMMQFAFMFKDNKVYADYNEIINNSNLIVNFNQISNNINVDVTNQSTASEGGYYYVNIAFANSVNFVVGHRYFIIFKLLDHSLQVANIRTYFNSYTQVYTSSGNRVTQLLTFSSFNFLRVYATNTNYFNLHYNFCAIDLDVMFGSDNIPTLDQCNELFIADYYPYNTGTALAYSQLSAYAQGVQSVLGSNVELSTEFIINNANPFTLPYNLYSGKIYYNYADYDADTGSDALITDGLYFLNGAFVPLGTTLSSGTNIYIKYDYASSLNNDNIKCNIYAINSKNELSLISIVENDYSFSSANLNYVITSDCIGIVFNIDTNNNYRWSFSGLTISYPMNNYEQVILDAYQNGYNSAKSYYEVYYGVGGVGYQSIYNLGYYAYPSDDHFTFQKLIYSVIDVPVQAITNLFDFDILGVNMKTFYLSLFTLAVIVTILRLVL